MPPSQLSGIPLGVAASADDGLLLVVVLGGVELRENAPDPGEDVRLVVAERPEVGMHCVACQLQLSV